MKKITKEDFCQIMEHSGIATLYFRNICYTADENGDVETHEHVVNAWDSYDYISEGLNYWDMCCEVGTVGYATIKRVDDKTLKGIMRNYHSLEIYADTMLTIAEKHNDTEAYESAMSAWKSICYVMNELDFWNMHNDMLKRLSEYR